jgi:glycosyltransferase involved in cell wall biosynthesis
MAAGVRRRCVAILSTWHPEPVDNGRKQRTRLIIDALALLYDVYLFSLVGSDQVESGDLPEVPGVAHTWALPLPEFRPRSVRGLVASFSGEPRSLSATWDQSLAKRVAALLSEYDVDAIIGTDMRTFRYLNALNEQAATVLDEPDVSPFVAPANSSLRERMRQAKYARVLAGNDDRLDSVVVASAIEADAYVWLSGRAHVDIIPNAVASIPNRCWTPTATSQALYTGSLTYGPNAEAVRVWAHEIYPSIASNVPDATLVVTGELPTALSPDVLQLSIRLTGRLEDLDAVFEKSRVFVAPIRSGTGTRVKLLEAMARGIPVVSTSKGFEGIDVVAGEHALIADEPRDFADATLRLMTDDLLATRIGAAGREFVRRRYNAPETAEQWRAIVEAAIQRRAAERPAT